MEENKNRQIPSCLRKERIVVRYIPMNDANITNPKHVLYGGMSEGSAKYYTVPVLASTGTYKNVLTDDEKRFLEEVMGLEYNALSIYKKENNFWDNFQVRLTKRDNYLDLSDPNDYIKYKVLKANTDTVAPSLEALQDYPKATYRFVLVREGETEKKEGQKISLVMKCYKEYGKIEGDAALLRCIVELLDKRPLAANTKLEFLQGKCNTLIQADPAAFYEVVTDPLLTTKLLIKNAVEAGVIAKRGNFYYIAADNTPLCNLNEDPVFNTAARFLNLPKNQELKLSIEAKIK